MSDAPASKSGFPENPHSKPLDSAMIISITDALVCFGQLLIIAGVVTENKSSARSGPPSGRP